MERRYKCKNGVVERTRYLVGDNAKPRGRRKKGSDSRKQESNFNQALRRVARILNCNADGFALLITLSYDAKGMDRIIAKLDPDQQTEIQKLQAPAGKIGNWKPAGKARTEGQDDQYKRPALDALRKEAEKELTNWIRRMKRKTGELKFLSVTSDIDGDTGELVRVHHHVVLMASAVSWDTIKNCWNSGGTDIKQLRNQPDYTPIAVYLMRQVRRQPDAKKYRCSRGMAVPEIEEREVTGATEIKVPAGATVFERMEYTADSVGQYVRYLPRKRIERRQQHEIQTDPGD